MEVGQLCVKLAGRDAGEACLIVDVLDENYVLVDGNTRRRKCNICHLEFLPKKTELKKGASTEDVKSALKALGITVSEKKERTRPKKTEGKKEVKEEKPEKKGILGLIRKGAKKKKEEAEAPKEEKKAEKGKEGAKAEKKPAAGKEEKPAKVKAKAETKSEGEEQPEKVKKAKK